MCVCWGVVVGGGVGGSNATSTAYEREMVLTFDQVIS